MIKLRTIFLVQPFSPFRKIPSPNSSWNSAEISAEFHLLKLFCFTKNPCKFFLYPNFLHSNFFLKLALKSNTHKSPVIPSPSQPYCQCTLTLIIGQQVHISVCLQKQQHRKGSNNFKLRSMLGHRVQHSYLRMSRFSHTIVTILRIHLIKM